MKAAWLLLLLTTTTLTATSVAAAQEGVPSWAALRRTRTAPRMLPEHRAPIRPPRARSRSLCVRPGEPTCELADVVRRQRRGFERCLRRHPAAGSFLFEVDVARGRVTDARVVRDDVGDAGLTRCLRRAWRRIDFPSGVSGTLPIPMIFEMTPADGASDP